MYKLSQKTVGDVTDVCMGRRPVASNKVDSKREDGAAKVRKESLNRFKVGKIQRAVAAVSNRSEPLS